MYLSPSVFSVILLIGIPLLWISSLPEAGRAGRNCTTGQYAAFPSIDRFLLVPDRRAGRGASRPPRGERSGLRFPKPAGGGKSPAATLRTVLPTPSRWSPPMPDGQGWPVEWGRRVRRKRNRGLASGSEPLINIWLYNIMFMSSEIRKTSLRVTEVRMNDRIQRLY